MADTPQQAEARRQLAARGNQLAPRVSEGRATRPGRATQRRAVVKGAVEGSVEGPAGAAAGAARGARKPRSPASSRTGRTARATGRYAGNRAGKFGIAKLDSPASGALFAEYFAGALIISLDLFTKSATAGYLGTMSKIMMRLTALTAVFFVLFLMTGSQRGGQAAIWFGLLVDLGIIFTAARSQTFTTLSDMIAGKGTGVTLDAVTTALAAPHPDQVQLPDE